MKTRILHLYEEQKLENFYNSLTVSKSVILIEQLKHIVPFPSVGYDIVQHQWYYDVQV